MNAADLLPPPSPALRVHQAAARLRTAAGRARAEMARNTYWDNGWAAGITDALGGAGGDLAALFTPDLATGFADWLDEVASANARHGVPLPSLALTIARNLTPTSEGAPA